MPILIFTIEKIQAVRFVLKFEQQSILQFLVGYLKGR